MTLRKLSAPWIGMVILERARIRPPHHAEGRPGLRCTNSEDAGVVLVAPVGYADPNEGSKALGTAAAALTAAGFNVQIATNGEHLTVTRKETRS